NGRALLDAYRTLAETIREERSITPAAEWLVDNFHIVEEQVREIRDDLPDEYYRELPKLVEGHLAGYPRVLGIAWAYVAHTDSRFDAESLSRMVVAYQRVEPLTLGELWAIAISLRIVLVENLRRTADRIVRGRAARETADSLADRLLGIGGAPPQAADRALDSLNDAKLPTAARVQLFQRLRDQDPTTTPALRWLEDRLAAEGTTAEETVRREHQRQAEMNVTVRNVITSMRLLSWFDWATFVESTSLVQATLGTYPLFVEMDFATRDRYRHAVEKLARATNRPEVEVARAAIAAGAGAADAIGSAAAGDAPSVEAERNRLSDPGYHLIGSGRGHFARSLGAREAVSTRIRRTAGSTRLYLGAIVLLTSLVVALGIAIGASAAPLVAVLLVGALALGPASDLAIALVNRLASAVVGPAKFPRLEFKDGVPTSHRTLVAIPTLLMNRDDVEVQVRSLEIHFLSNPDGDVRFAMLSDWRDAATEQLDDDDDLLAAAAAAVGTLNERHGEAPGGGPRFLLFHRRRRWNEGEGLWMGWERKRGKLHELNALLRGSAETDYLRTSLAASVPPMGVRYVITLDGDTRLPRSAVARLVGTIAHPLNHPSVDPRTGRVTGGYGILQPRITPTLPAERDASPFQRISSGPAGIDPYASAISDVYQDLFAEGSYTGKGIYEIDAFEQALDGRVPENALLSHDLFEGSFARAGLVTDIELFEEHPANYLEAAARQHRWARGDWQLLPWILGRSRPSGERARDTIPALARWKMLDNLRRTLSAPLALATLTAAWSLPGVSAPVWTMLVLLGWLIPAALPVAAGLLPRRSGISKRSHLRAVASDVTLATTRIGLDVTVLAYTAALMADAIGRTLARLVVTRRRLLEWTTASQTKGSVGLDLVGFYRLMAGSVVIACATWVVVTLAKPAALPIALPFVVLWLLAPAIARALSAPPRATSVRELSEAEAHDLRLVARRTWRFFEAFVGAEDHGLPPDNYQEEPAPVIAHRTSPTNIGMYLLSILSARDFGWIGTVEAIERLEATLETVAGLARYRGHLFNWYDTRELRPLEPQYVSSVDSGNLCGALLVVAEACRQMKEQPIPMSVALTGLEDVLDLTRLAAAATGDERRTQTLGREHLMEAFERFAASARSAATDDTLAHEDSDARQAGWPGQLATLAKDARTLADVAWAFTAERGEGVGTELVAWAEAGVKTVESHERDLSPPPALSHRLGALADLAERLFNETEFGFLFDPTRKLFSIGYRVADVTLDPSYYDLLASESRLGSFLAVAKGDVPAEHWFRLGRSLTPVGRGSALISWSGSMFEYLMPALVMHAPAGSLLDQTYRLVVGRQMSYAAERGVPWGISESAFNARDVELTYQYSSFGVPGLGLKRGLAGDVVIAPYATVLAALIRPEAAVANIARLNAAGAAGKYGLHDALDYTPERLPEGTTVAVVKSYMAHHQGMVLVAIGNVLNESAMVHRFHASAIVQATELLLQERMPRDVLVARPRADEVRSVAGVRDLVPPVLRRFRSPHDQTPRTHLLSNGRYAVMVTAAGSGYSRWGDLAVTRWREDVTRDAWGSYVYLRDAEGGAVWSAGHQPSGREADSYEVRYSEEHAEFSRRDGSITTAMTIVVSAEHDAEIRRVSLTNVGSRSREIELTSYAEIVLATQAADVAHPAFQNLFVQTEFVSDVGALVATRRPRSKVERQVWAAHVMALEERPIGHIQYETDRARFLGRGRSVRSPVSVIDGRPLSNTVGAVLDPIFSLRCRVVVPPGGTAHVVFSTVVGDSRDAVLDLADKYREAATYERAATLAWTQAQVQLRHLGIDADEAHLFQRLANRILYSDPTLRPAESVLAQNDRGAPALWPHGISGDLPIVLVRIDESADLDIIRQLLRAHEYWRLKLLEVDLVIINEHGASYAQDLDDALGALVRMSQSVLGRDPGSPGGRVYVLRGDRLPAEDRMVLQAAARAVLLSRGGSLADQVLRLERPVLSVPTPPRATARSIVPQAAPARPDLELFNGLGGFADDGREYVVALAPGQATPAPWINVIANERFGFQVSESGAGYTWSENSRENKLTTWANDPVGDPPGEAIYIRDDDDGEVWTPTASPVRSEGSTYFARHGMGYSRFDHERDGIALQLVQFVAADDPVKVSVLSIENRSGRARRLSVTAYVEWVLGTERGSAAPHIASEIQPGTGALLARNAWNSEFPGRVAFLDLAGRQTGWTADRTEFVGRNGSLERPAALARGNVLRQEAGSGLDPCAALQTRFELADGERTDVVVLLGEAPDAASAAEIIGRTRAADHWAVLAAAKKVWLDLAGTVQVRTPDRSMDVLLNSWLLYQAVSSRLWGRTGLYQAGGAYGFRDQLQDVMALTTARPDLTRAQLLRAAAQQFRAGDVQHWWHPPSGRGVRTHISDDRLWLPFVASRYVVATGDLGIMEEQVPFLEGPELRQDQEDSYFQPERSTDRVSLFEHCARAIDVSLEAGSHGLPLMGTGDWNDGMNRVGNEGRGESVWLGWFLYAAIRGFLPLADARGEADRASRWRARAKALRSALDRHGWDGDWYRRGFFDDGTPLGSAVNTECRIDSIAQSWSVLSGGAKPGRARQAMAAMEEYLVRRGDGLVLLFTPPFDRSDVDPGYIKGYLPGIRENGGQYTHGAIWAAMAFAALGEGDKATELFSILNPINHAATRAGVHRYKVEPYVIAADVYAEPSHVGRGGWTWYTGSAGWMYQAGLESILGFRIRGAKLEIEPAIPRSWRGYEISYRHRSSRYEISVENQLGISSGVSEAWLDDARIASARPSIPLVDDGR
ncbi:MAG: glucoamylase family protein, partial [Candidatus Limnocylindrales bacterium]